MVLSGRREWENQEETHTATRRNSTHVKLDTHSEQSYTIYIEQDPHAKFRGKTKGELNQVVITIGI